MIPTRSLAPLSALATQEHVYKGRPCLRGHDGTRYKASRNCVVCSRERALAKWKREQARMRAEDDVA